MMLTMLLLLLLLLLVIILVVNSITNNSNPGVIAALSVVNSDSYALQKGDNIDEFIIEERLDYLGLPSLYWFDPNEIIEYDKLDDNDDSKTMVTTIGSTKMLPFLPLLPEPSLLSTSSSASKGYITILKQLRSNDEMNNTTCIRNGTFCIDQLIFHGGHGDVYKANRIDYDGNIEFNTSYILKRMYVNDRPAIERCALREIYFGELLKGQARIARYERYFQDNDNYWLVFLDEGVSLQSLLYVISVNNGLAVMEPSQFWVRLRKLDANMLRSIMKQIILGVSQLHDMGIIHRDCKPSNILIRTENSKPKLVIADFSSAVSDISLINGLYGDAGPRIDEETLSYAPPEVLLSLTTKAGREIPYDSINPESYDIWSIGVIFLELILGTGEVFTLDQRTTALINQRIKNDDKAKADALLLAALADYCILPQNLKEIKTNLYDVTLYAENNDNDKTKKRKEGNYPLFKNADGYYTIQDQPRCGLEELRLAILKRDPLAIGFNDRWGLDLIRKLLTFKASERISLSKALKHAYFVGSYISEIDGTEHATEEELRSYDNNIEESDTNENSSDLANDIIFTCSSCGRKFNDYYACHKHIIARGHSKCYYDQSQLPPCLSESSFLPMDPASGWCDLQGRRAYIEDEHIIYYKDDHKFFGVLDGHFGVDASNYVGRNLYNIFYQEIKLCESSDLTSSFNDAIDQMSANLDINNQIEWKNVINITKNMNDVLMIDEKRNKSVNAATAVCAIKKAFNQVNTNFIRASKSNSTSGTTATIAILFKNHLLISHVGDSRVVLCCNSDGFPIQVTHDHTPYSHLEYKRVYDSGGFIEKNGGVLRVNGRLAITRSIGDKNMREVLSSTPDVLLVNLEESNTMKNSVISNNNCVKYANLLGSSNLMFMVLASDGLWDVVSNQDATEIVCEYLMNELLSNQKFDKNENYVNYDSLHNAAKLLAHEAYVRQSMDNIGVCVTMILK